MDRRGFFRLALGAVGIAATMGVPALLTQPVERKLMEWSGWTWHVLSVSVGGVEFRGGMCADEWTKALEQAAKMRGAQLVGDTPFLICGVERDAIVVADR